MPFKKGESGNPTGRPLGSKNKVAEDFWADILKEWEEHGANLITKVREEDPVQFFKTVASNLPKDFTFNLNENDKLSISELEEKCRALGNALGLLGDTSLPEREEETQRTH